MGGCPKNSGFQSLCHCTGHFILHLLGNKLWWADQGTDQIGTCDKKDGGNWKVLRNSTSPMMHMKIYNETVQKGATTCFGCHVQPVCVCSHLFQSLGFYFVYVFVFPGTNLCSNNNGDCSQLCLPTSATTRACMCTAGYSLRTGQRSCEGTGSVPSDFGPRNGRTDQRKLPFETVTSLCLLQASARSCSTLCTKAYVVFL